MDDLSNRKEQIIKIKNGKGIQYILDEAYRILGNPILTHDMDYNVIAYSENPVTDDPIWNEFETTGMVGRDRQVFYKEECFYELCANAKKTVFLLSDELKYNRIFGKLFTKYNIQVAVACMVECYNPFEDDTPELFEIVCDILSKELSKSEFYLNYGRAYMDTLIGQLIENSIEDIELYIAHIESIYITTKSNLYLAVADITQYDPTHTKLAYFRGLFKQTRPDFKYAIYSKYIVIVISTDETNFHVKKDFNRLFWLFEYYNIFTGISNSFENIFELPQRYDEAVNALNHGLKSNSGQRIFLSGDIIDDASGETF